MENTASLPEKRSCFSNAPYVVNKADIENLGEVASSPAAQAKARWLPYRSVAEAVAEKFHCDLNFLKELNPGITEKLKENILEVHVGEKLAAVFPVTVGSQHTASPIGRWTVKGIAKLPNFRYDLKMLKEGKRSSNSHLLPPGQTIPRG